MKKASIVVLPFYQNNKLFDLEDNVVNRDNCMHPFFTLKEKFFEYGYDLSTQDINSVSESEVVLYNEMPKLLPQEEAIEKSYLMIFESELIKPENWDFNKHSYFHKIFTWNDSFVDNKKYFKFNFSQQIIKNINKDLSKKENLCTLIAGNKKSKHPLELYSKRVEAIRWFEVNHSDEFDLYGVGWDDFSSANRYIKFIVKKLHLSKLLAKQYPSYLGKVDKKKETLEKYKFVICYENARDISGYITEKIFDCLFAGSIPVYWGAQNITDFIPAKCFIDKRDFNSYEELYRFMKDMSDEVYLEYVHNIEHYLNSDEISLFSSDSFSEVIVSRVV